MGDAELMTKLTELNKKLEEMGLSGGEKPIIDIVPIKED